MKRCSFEGCSVEFHIDCLRGVGRPFMSEDEDGEARQLLDPLKLPKLYCCEHQTIEDLSLLQASRDKRERLLKRFVLNI